MSWFVLSIKENQETLVEETLLRMGVEVFNPSIKGIKYWSNRQKRVTMPLFKSHIFIRLEEKYKGIVFGVSGIKGYMFLEGKPVIVSNEEVSGIRQWLLQEKYDSSLLKKLIAEKELSIEKWLSRDTSGIKSWDNRLTSQPIDAVLKHRLKDVV
ncbi:hypothetical protein MHTCC0001_29340 [Flavobacteriaceae bacterium MHTCC 0001]